MSMSMIGLDIAKSVFQLHGIDTGGKVQLKRKPRRGELIAFFERQPRCTVVMEACGAAHHRARVSRGLGHEVKLIAPEAVRPFVKRGKKNDAADAAAICAAASRPDARFVAVKSLEQQGVLALHSARALLVRQQTMLANAMRGLATGFGLVVPKGMDKLGELVALVEGDETFPARARGVFTGLLEQCRATADRIEDLEAEIVAHARGNGAGERHGAAPGHGPRHRADHRLAARGHGRKASGTSRARGTSRPGSGGCQASTRPAAKPALAGSRRRATARSEGCGCSAPRRWCTAPGSGAVPPGRGCGGCWSGVLSGW